MDLEQRVQALEQEIAILKGQIQATLLDIQEQLLSRAYPALQSEDTVMPAPSSNGTNSNGSNNGQRGSEASVNVRKVSLNPTMPEPEAYDFAPEQAEPDWEQLEAWAVQKVQKSGAKRARELIRAYSEQGRFSEATGKALLHVVTLYDGDPESTLPARPRSFPNAQYISPAQESVSIPHPKPASQPKPKVKAAKAPIQPKTPPQPKASAAHAKRITRTVPAVSAEEDSQSQKLVLRLIAGVHNAGVKWTKGAS